MSVPNRTAACTFPCLPFDRSMLIRPLLILAAGLILGSCNTVRQPEGPGPERVPGQLHPDDVATVDRFFKEGGKAGFVPSPDKTPALTKDNSWFHVDLDAQRLYFFANGRVVAASNIASGRKYYRTETGNYTLGQKDLNHRSTTYGSFVKGGTTIMSDVQAGFDPLPPGAKFQGAMMKYFMRFHRNGKSTAMGFHQGPLPGYPASHGCVRLPGFVARWLFENTAMHTPILVRGTKYGVAPGVSQNRPRRSPKVHPTVRSAAKPDASVPPAPEAESGTPEPPSSPAGSETGAPSGTSAPEPATDSGAAPEVEASTSSTSPENPEPR